MLKLIKHSFTFKGIFSIKDYPKKIIYSYLLILIFVTSFPLNLQIIQNDGWQELNTVTLAWREVNPSWLPNGLPNDLTISRLGLTLPTDETYYYETTNAGVKNVLIINPTDKEPGINETVYSEKGIKTKDNEGNIHLAKYERTILLCKDKVIYYKDSNKSITGKYDKISNTINTSSLKELSQAEAASLFLTAIDSSFNKYIIFSSVLINTLTQFVLNIVLVFLISAIFMLVRIKYQKVTTFSQNINIVVSSMTIPSLLSFIIGIIGVIELTSFSVVLFQLLTPLLAIGAIYKGSKIKDPIIKDVV